MARYRRNLVGVHDNDTGEDIAPGNYAEWQAYLAWLAAGNALDPLPVVVMTLAQQRTEAFARLDERQTNHALRGLVSALGVSWTVTPEFLTVLAIHGEAMPPVPAGFTLPDADGLQVPLDQHELVTLIRAVSSRLIAVNAKAAALRAVLAAVATPLAVDLDTGWPP